MGKLSITRLNSMALVVFCLIVTASIAYATSWNKQQNSTDFSANENGKSSSYNPPIPNNMMPAKELMQTDPKIAKDMTLVEIISNDSRFSNLNKALKLTGLDVALAGQGPFTLFAPNDQAFAKLSPNALADLLNPNYKDKLIAILTYHVLPGKITEDKLKTMKMRTLQGKTIDVVVDGDKKTVNNSKILGEGIEGSNGVVYIVDTVLMP